MTSNLKENTRESRKAHKKDTHYCVRYLLSHLIWEKFGVFHERMVKHEIERDAGEYKIKQPCGNKQNEPGRYRLSDKAVFVPCVRIHIRCEEGTVNKLQY